MAGLQICAALSVLSGLAGIWPQLDSLNHATPLLGLASLALLSVAVTSARGSGRRLNLVIAGLGAFAAAVSVVPDAAARLRDFGTPPCAGPVLKLYSQNVWGDNPDPADTAAAIRRSAPDIILLQEVRGPSRLIVPLLRPDYPYVLDCSDNRYCGLTILSKWPMTSQQHHQGKWRPPEYDRLTYLRTRIPGAPGGSLSVMTLHLSHPRLGSQAQQLRQLAATLKTDDVRDLVLTGDFNATPWMYDLRRFDAATPLVRLTKAFATWPARFPVIGGRVLAPAPFLPLDQAYAGPGWRACEVKRGPRTGSDHYGVLITLRPA